MFKVDGERVRIIHRERGTPIDKVVAEMMILVNSRAGALAADHKLAAIYRAQQGGKTRMTTDPLPHQGLGVSHYTWTSSPLRRYVDLINQRQLIAHLRGETPPYTARGEEMQSAMRAFETAYRITRRGGTTVTAGLPHPTATWPMPSTNLVAEERTIKGSYIGTCVPSRDLPRYIDLYQRGRLPVDRLMSGRLGLEEINEGFDRLHEGKAVRQVVTFA